MTYTFSFMLNHVSPGNPFIGLHKVLQSLFQDVAIDGENVSLANWIHSVAVPEAATGKYWQAAILPVLYPVHIVNL